MKGEFSRMLITYLLTSFLIGAMPCFAQAINVNHQQKPVSYEHHLIARKQKKVFKKLRKLKNRKKVGLFLLFPLAVLSTGILIGVGISGASLIGFGFLNILSFIGFFFTRKKGDESSMKLGNGILIALIIINLLGAMFAPLFFGV